jgi:hypothetical protein
MINMTTTINTFNELEEYIGNKSYSFWWFFWIGYTDQEKLVKDSKERIEKDITLNGKVNVMIVCGGN